VALVRLATAATGEMLNNQLPSVRPQELARVVIDRAASWHEARARIWRRASLALPAIAIAIWVIAVSDRAAPLRSAIGFPDPPYVTTVVLQCVSGSDAADVAKPYLRSAAALRFRAGKRAVGDAAGRASGGRGGRDRIAKWMDAWPAAAERAAGKRADRWRHHRREAVTFTTEHRVASLPWSILPGILAVVIPSHTAAAQSAPEDPRVPPEVAIQAEDYAEVRQAFSTTLVKRGPSPQKPPALEASGSADTVSFHSGLLTLHAWISHPATAAAGTRPAVLFPWRVSVRPGGLGMTWPYRAAGFMVMDAARGEQPGGRLHDVLR
jgi:hypothetical protein